MCLFNAKYYLAILCFLLLNVTSYSQVWITETSPSKNQISVHSNSNIIINFSRPLLESSVNSGNVIVKGSVRGLYSSNLNYSDPNRTLIIDPDANFKPGERINVTVTGYLQDQQSNFMEQAVNISFTAAAEGGTGTFTLSQEAIITESKPNHMTSGDLDNDGDADIIVVNRNSNNIDILFNNGLGSFTKTIINSDLYSPSDTDCGDIDNDGDIDFVVSWEGNAFSVYKNNGTGVFAQSEVITAGLRPLAVKLFNIDKDGYPDIAIANWGSDNVAFYRNNGEGNFIFLSYIHPGIRPLTFASGDADNDGDIDLAIGIDWNPAQVAIEKNDGFGNFSLSQLITVRDRPYSITENNFDNNFYLDFCSSNLYDNTLSVMLNNGGVFSSALVTAGGADARKIINGDFDADGDIDLALASSNSEFISTYKNNGNAVFTGYLLQNTFGKAYQIISNDFDGDGDLDLATTNHSTNSLSIFRNNNSFGYNSITQIDNGSVPNKFVLKQNYPNPFNPSTSINFRLPENGFVTLKIYSSSGKEISSLVNKNLDAGEYSVNFDADRLSLESGVYFYKIIAGQFTDSKKMFYIK